jgi:hypothetical protein
LSSSGAPIPVYEVDDSLGDVTGFIDLIESSDVLAVGGHSCPEKEPEIRA